MGRQEELIDQLPPQDWNNYSDYVPLYSRDGKGYKGRYLGRDIAAGPKRKWQARAISAAAAASALTHTLILENSVVAGVLATVYVIADMGSYGRVTNRLLKAVNPERRIINPQK